MSVADDIEYSDPVRDPHQPFMRWQLAHVKTERGLFYATVGLSVIEEKHIQGLGAEVHEAWLAMKRAELTFRLLRNVAVREPLRSDTEFAVLEP